MTTFWRTTLAVVIALATGCGGEGPSETDGGGREDGSAPMDATMPPPDAAPVVLCAADSECDDGLYCNGVETCMIGAAGAGADGCLPGSAPCDAAGDSCDEESGMCVTSGCDGANADRDGDGDDRIECGGSDCDDDNPNVYGTAQEICDADGLDEDCDPSTIQDSTSNDGDMDGDGFISTSCFNPRPGGGENRGDDCDDGRPTINPDGVEACDGRDNDCDTMIDEDVLETYYRDADGDNFGDDTMTMMDCTAPAGWVFVGGDCNDRDRTINPGATELCDTIDNNCSGTADDPPSGCSCTTGDTRGCGPLAAFDGVGICRRSSQTCVAGRWPTECPGAVYPRTSSSGTPYDPCGMGDEDCDGTVDEDGLLPYYLDADRDGYGNPAARMDFCPGDEPSTYVTNSRDCDDSVMSINPDAIEICDGIDNDCMGGIDNVVPACGGCLSGMTRPCGTNTGVCMRGTETCSVAGVWEGCTATMPESPFEQCGGGDEDCDGLTNDADPDIMTSPASMTGAQVWWRDADGDTYGTMSDARTACVAPAGYVLSTLGNDCNDTVGGTPPGALINPGQPELCNGYDDNCTMGADEGCGGVCTVGMSRACPDGSDVGDCVAGTQTCTAGGTWGTCAGQIGPVVEQCGGGDEDCDGMTNDIDPSLPISMTGASEYWQDMDGDGFGNSAVVLRSCTRPPNSVPAGVMAADCDDSTDQARPDIVTEAGFVCDGINNNCAYDSTIDEDGSDALDCYVDSDSDTYGDDATLRRECFACSAGRVERGGDCRDDIALVRPNQRQFFTSPACPAGLSPVTCTGGSFCGTCSGPPAEVDYDCSGTVEVQPSGWCSAAGIGDCSFARGPDPSVMRPPNYRCYTLWPFVTGCTPPPTLECTITNELVGCR